MIFLLLPHQLFDYKYLDKSKSYILWEHPKYFKDYNFNKKKLLLHRGSMQYYYKYLLSKKYKIKYFTFKQLPKITNYEVFDPIDKIKLPGKYTILDSPNFLLSIEDNETLRKKSKSFFFNSFYMKGKKIVDIIPEVKSQDKLNRKTLSKKINVPKYPTNKADYKYIKIGCKYVNSHFKKNYGNTENFIFPLTHKTAKKFLLDFIKNRLTCFGTYQDFTRKDGSNLFHSILSTSINIGLINPGEIIDILRKMKSKYPINSFEGYIRQLFWREYQRYCYRYFDFDKVNYFGNKLKLTKKWYTGDLDVLPVDNAIKKAFDTGYLHHIERLMIVGNFMMISGISPKEGYKWFMEFSCDSYEWVMKQNVLDMVFCVSGGKTMRKPYISKSNYIITMSDYNKGEWSEKWDAVYVDFAKKNKKKLLDKFRYHFHFIKNY
jgi:deoxyribodipyrimidine photolyase-related protein